MDGSDNNTFSTSNKCQKCETFISSLLGKLSNIKIFQFTKGIDN